jgi:hypothetical protein
MPSPQNLLQKLVSLGERQGATEAAALELIRTFLANAGITSEVTTFTVTLPVERSAVLTIDGKTAPCAATSFASGVIPDKEIVISSAMPMALSPDLPNININPYCPVISKGNHYRKPAIAVSHEVLDRILRGKNVRAEIEVDLVEAEAHNILVGNAENPRTIVFTHFDSIGPGANDNATGTATVCDVLARSPQLMDGTLFVISGSEELSTDLPYYWGAGYRRFQEQYGARMRSAEKILVVDSVGCGTITPITDARTIRRAFPVTDMDAIIDKIQLIAGNLEGLMPVYHSAADTLDRVEDASLAQAARLLEECCA